MAYKAEWIRNAIKTRLEDNFAAALDTIEAEWADTDPVTLPDVETWFLGHKPTVLELESSEFPFVAIIIADRVPKTEPIRWGYQEQVITAYVDYFVVAADETTVNKIAHRYAEAIITILQGENVIEGFTQQNYEAEVALSEASRHAKHKEADMFAEADVDFIKMGRVTILLEGG